MNINDLLLMSQNELVDMAYDILSMPPASMDDTFSQAVQHGYFNNPEHWIFGSRNKNEQLLLTRAYKAGQEVKATTELLNLISINEDK